jgi:hypothetical protein
MKLLAAILILCLSAPAAVAYSIDRSVIGGGGGSAASSDYRMNSTIGQTAIGITSGVYQLEAGYWYRITGGTGICGDVDDSGVVNILDVRLLMNHVADPPGYPVDAWAGDVDGADGIDMADVQLLVAYVFNPAGHSLHCPT